MPPSSGLLDAIYPGRVYLPLRPWTTYTASKTRKSRDIMCTPPLTIIMSAEMTGLAPTHCSDHLLDSSDLCSPCSRS